MRLEQAARRSVFAVIGAAWLIVLATPEYGLLWIAGGAAVLLMAWRSRGRWVQRRGGRRFWRVMAVGALVALPLDLLLSASVLHPAIHMALLTQALMLFDAPAPRRHRLLVVLSLFDVLAATVLTQSLLFAVLLLLYAGLAIVALTLLHLVESAAEAAPTPAAAAAEALRFGAARPLVLVMLSATLAVVPIVVLLFLTLPRWEYSLLARTPMNTDAVRRLQQLDQARKQTGFSDRVELGDYGRVQEDPTVVMRVKFPTGRPEALAGRAMYWRAGALDYYDGYSWAASKSEFAYYRGDPANADGQVMLALGEGRGHIPPTVGSTVFVSTYLADKDVASLEDLRNLADVIEQEVFLELPYADNVLGLPRVVAIDGFFPRGLSADLNGSYRVLSRPLLAEKVSYTAFSVLPTADPTDLGDLTMDTFLPLFTSEFFGPFFQEHYLQVPRNLTAEVRRQVEELTAGAPTVDAKVAALLDYFSGFTYSLETERVALGSWPLDDFLFATQQGYCEHFATAMVIMLRTAGIPARLATGFKGGIWNAVGEFYAIRQADAHTWAEVWVPGHGWIPVDPVPGGNPAPDLQPWLVPEQNAYLLYARAFWQEQVLGYNLANQTRAASLAWQWVRARPGVVWDWLRRVLGSIGRGVGWLLGVGLAWATVLAPVALGAVLFILYVWRNGLPGGTLPLPGRRGPLVPFYREMLRALYRAGFEKGPSDPPRAFAGRVGAVRPDLAADVRALTHMYERVRFAGRGLTGPETASVHATLKHLRRRAPRTPVGVADD